jgi:PleD family two-component response regulator
MITDPHTVCALHRENRYDLILLDLQMPDMDGFQVMEGLKEVETDGYLPVLAITAQLNHKLRALTSGGEEVETQMKSADLALYEAKRTGKNDYRMAAHLPLEMERS